MKDIAKVYFSLEDKLLLPWLREQVRQLPASDLWQRKARSSLRDQLDRTLTDNCAGVVAAAEGISEEKLCQWLLDNQPSIERWEATVTDIQSASEQNLAMLSVAVQELSLMS